MLQYAEIAKDPERCCGQYFRDTSWIIYSTVLQCVSMQIYEHDVLKTSIHFYERKKVQKLEMRNEEILRIWFGFYGNPLPHSTCTDAVPLSYPAYQIHFFLPPRVLTKLVSKCFAIYIKFAEKFLQIYVSFAAVKVQVHERNK
jgi:hypothetical protein